MKNKKVLLINQGRSENLGDKAINFVLKESLKDGYEVHSTGFSQIAYQNIYDMTLNYNEYNKKSVIKLFLHPIIIWFFKYIKMIIMEFVEITKCNKFDLVIIGGGQLIKTRNVFPYVMLTWVSLFKLKTNSKIILFGVGSDDKFTFLEKNIYRYVFKNIDGIYVRDNDTKENLIKNFKVNCKYVPDVVFSFSEYFDNQDVEFKKNKLLLMIYDYKSLKRNFCKNISYKEYYDSWINILSEYNESNLDIVLGYTTIGDKCETELFKEYLLIKGYNNITISDTDDLVKFIELLKESKIVISGRMHALILAMNYGCEVIPYEVSPKLTTFKNECLNKDMDIIKIREKINENLKDIDNFICK